MTITRAETRKSILKKGIEQVAFPMRRAQLHENS